MNKNSFGKHSRIDWKLEVNEMGTKKSRWVTPAFS